MFIIQVLIVIACVIVFIPSMTDIVILYHCE